jgi:hypothetical protein
MGYTTYFLGKFEVTPPLNDAEIEYLGKFSETRRMRRHRGPYYVDGGGLAGQDREDDIISFNAPPEGQPGLWCQWTPNENGDALVWDEGEKFYEAELWINYLINHFLKPGAEASKTEDPQFAEFTFDHTVKGIVEAQGRDIADRWCIVVKNNKVERLEGLFSYRQRQIGRN